MEGKVFLKRCDVHLDRRTMRKMCPFQRKYEHHVRYDFFSVVKGAVNMAHLQLVHVWILFRTYTMLDITNIIVLRQILFKECTISLFLFLLAHYAASFWPQQLLTSLSLSQNLSGWQSVFIHMYLEKFLITRDFEKHFKIKSSELKT